jgi:hypothetical protein
VLYFLRQIFFLLLQLYSFNENCGKAHSAININIIVRMVNIVNDDTYFSEREQGLLPQDKDNITQHFWPGFAALIERYIDNGLLTKAFPEYCHDFEVPVAVDIRLLSTTLEAEIRSVNRSVNRLPLKLNNLPDTLSGLDEVEFFYRYVAKPTHQEYHDYLHHNHLISFDQEAGQKDYLAEVNRLFRRNNLAFELKANGKVERLGPIILRDILASGLITFI